MYRSEDVAGIKEFKGSGVFAIYKPNTVKAMHLKAAFVIWVTAEPVDPEEFHALSLYRPWASHIDMKDSEDLRILVGVAFHTFFFIFVSKSHEIQVGLHIDQVLRMAQVVGRVVNANDIMLVHTVANKCNAVSLFIRERMLVSVIWNVILACQ